MNIGYGSISVYDSIRHQLFFDKKNNIAFFEAYGYKYNIKLNDEYIENIFQNKKIWITLSQLPPTQISKNTIFEPTFKLI